MNDARPSLQALLLVALAAACDREPPLPPLPPRPTHSAAAIDPSVLAPRPPPPVSSEAQRALAEIRERSVSLVAPPPSSRRLAFGRGFVVQLREAELVVRSSRDGAELARAPMTALAATTLPLGQVLVAAPDASYRIEAGAPQPARLNRLSLLPGSELHPSRESPEHVWVVHTALRKALRFALAPDAGLGLERERALPGYDGRAFTTLLDGAFLYSAGTELALATGRPEPRKLGLGEDAGRVWRLFAADRIDRSWLATDAGELVLFELGSARAVRRIRTGRKPFDVAATGAHVALVGVEEGALRRFVLDVYEKSGKLRFQVALPSPPATSDPDWFARLAEDKQVALAEDPPRVAVGGRAHLTLYDLETGEPVFTD